MRIEIEGDSHIAQEVIQQIQLWDKAVVGKRIDDLIHQCANDVSMFDVSSQLNGIHQYKTEWEKFSPYFNENMHISPNFLPNKAHTPFFLYFSNFF